MSEWISVKQKMPPERDVVLGSFERAGIQLTSWFQWEEMDKPLWSPGVRLWGNITHWMPLPAPPETK